MKERSQAMILSEFIESVGQAATGSWALAHYLGNIKFLAIRDNLERIKTKCVAIAVSKEHFFSKPQGTNVH